MMTTGLEISILKMALVQCAQFTDGQLATARLLESARDNTKQAARHPKPTVQQPPLWANPHGTSAFFAGTNEAVSSVVESGLIVMVSPAVPPRLYMPVEPEASVAALSPNASRAATPTPAAIGLMDSYISTSQIFIAIGGQRNCDSPCGTAISAARPRA